MNMHMQHGPRCSAMHDMRPWCLFLG